MQPKKVGSAFPSRPGIHASMAARGSSVADVSPGITLPGGETKWRREGVIGPR